MKNYVVLTGDLIHSRSLKNRSETQEKLKSVLKATNEKYAEIIIAPFVIVWGDSFQGTFNTINGFYSLLENLEKNLSLEFRCGIGVGSIITKISKNPLEMDGPAFHQSQQALEYAKQKHHKIWINSGNDQNDNIINSLLLLLEVIKNGWTTKQKEVISLRRQKLTYKDIGKRLNITKQAVSNFLKRANWKETSFAIESLNNLSYQP